MLKKTWYILNWFMFQAIFFQEKTMKFYLFICNEFSIMNDICVSFVYIIYMLFIWSMNPNKNIMHIFVDFCFQTIMILINRETWMASHTNDDGILIFFIYIQFSLVFIHSLNCWSSFVNIIIFTRKWKEFSK